MEFLSKNTPGMKLARTIAQGIVGVIIAYIDVLVAQISVVPDEFRPFIVAIVMAILAPTMAVLGGKEPEVEDVSKDVQP